MKKAPEVRMVESIRKSVRESQETPNTEQKEGVADIDEASLEGKYCFTAITDEYDEMEDGTLKFIPCKVDYGESGYAPMRGRGEGATPWYWGNSYKECAEACMKYNTEELGLTPTEAALIIASSMRRR